MNPLVRTPSGGVLTLTDEDIDTLTDMYAEKIGHVDDAECDRIMKRMAQLERCKASSHYLHDFERAA